MTEFITDKKLNFLCQKSAGKLACEYSCAYLARDLAKDLRACRARSKAKGAVVTRAEYVDFVHIGVLPSKHGELEDAICDLEKALSDLAALDKEIGDAPNK